MHALPMRRPQFPRRVGAGKVTVGGEQTRQGEGHCPPPPGHAARDGRAGTSLGLTVWFHAFSVHTLEVPGWRALSPAPAWPALQSEPRVWEKAGTFTQPTQQPSTPYSSGLGPALLSSRPASPFKAVRPRRSLRPRARLPGSPIPPPFVASWVPTLWALIPSSVKWVHKHLYLPVPGAGTWDSAVSLVLSQPGKALPQERGERDACPLGHSTRPDFVCVGESSAQGKVKVAPETQLELLPCILSGLW